MTSHDPPHISPQFVTTHWSAVLAAAATDELRGRCALAELCEQYWIPLYSYARRHVADVHEAQDYTQAFFARLLEKETLAVVRPDRGRFRDFLLASFKNFISNEAKKARAGKRGGGRAAIPLDFMAGESRISLEPADNRTPEMIYQRQWAITLLRHVMERLAAEAAESGRARQFELLRDFVAGQAEDAGYLRVSQELGISPAAAKQAAHRLRKRYRELLRAEVACTVSTAEEVDDELRDLLNSVRL